MRILLVDDHRVLLAGLAALLRGQDWINAIDTATNSAEALSAGAAPAVVLPGREPVTRRLADRERDLLRLLAKGRSTDEIARELFLSPKTIRNRLSELYAVLGVRNRAEAVAVAYELGM